MNKPKEQRRKQINIPIKAVFMGSNDSSIANLKQYRDGNNGLREYRGSFPTSVKQIIKEVVTGRVLNLYSGRSDIGNVRVDLECPEATHNMSVEEFICQDNERWDWVIIDPPYKIKNIDFLKHYADARPLTGNALLRDRLRLYLRGHADNVLWLDYCSPTVKGFERHYIWLLMPGNCWESCRVLTWIKRVCREFDYQAINLSGPGTGSEIQNPPSSGDPGCFPRPDSIRAERTDSDGCPAVSAHTGTGEGFFGVESPSPRILAQKSLVCALSGPCQ